MPAYKDTQRNTWYLKTQYLAIAVIGCICTYVYPLMAHFDNSVGNTLKNAVLLPLANPFIALVATALNLLPVLIMLINFELFVTVSFLWLVIGFSLTALVNTKMLGWLFARFAPQKPEENQGANE